MSHRDADIVNGVMSHIRPIIIENENLTEQLREAYQGIVDTWDLPQGDLYDTAKL